MATKSVLNTLRLLSLKPRTINYNFQTLHLKRPYNIPLVHKYSVCTKVIWRNIIEPRYVIHVGNILAVCAMLQTDMLYLRGFMIGASVCGIVFNLLQPIPLITPAYWGLFFMFTHSIQIYYLLRDKVSITMSNDLNKIYEAVFLNAGFTAKQFIDLYKHSNSTLITYQKGQHITSDKSDTYTYCLMNGRAAIKTDKLGNICIVDTKDNNDDTNTIRWFGEFLHPNTDIVSYECLSECKVIRFDKKKLDAFLNENDDLKQKADKIMVNDILGKYRNMKESNILNSYTGMISVYIKCKENKEENNKSLDEIKDYLQRFATENHVDRNYIDLFLQQNHGMRYNELFE